VEARKVTKVKISVTNAANKVVNNKPAARAARARAVRAGAVRTKWTKAHVAVARVREAVAVIADSKKEYACIAGIFFF
jgi:hypothetical protein